MSAPVLSWFICPHHYGVFGVFANLALFVAYRLIFAGLVLLGFDADAARHCRNRC